MNKAQFNQELRKRLSVLPNFEIEKSLSYFNEMIEDRMEEGMTEEEAVAKLGDIRFLAEKILEEEGKEFEQAEALTEVAANATESEHLPGILSFLFWTLVSFMKFVLYFALWLNLWLFSISTIFSGIATVCMSLLQLSSGPQAVVLTAGVGLISFGIGCLCMPLAQQFHRHLLHLYHNRKQKGGF